MASRLSEAVDGRLTEALKTLSAQGGTLDDLEVLKNPEANPRAVDAARGVLRVLRGEEVVQKSPISPAALIAPPFTYAQFNTDAFIRDWTRYWKERWGKKVGFTGVRLPQIRHSFDWGIFVPQGVMLEALFQGAKKHYTTSKWLGDSLDLAIPTNDRTSKSGYVVWCRATQEAGEYPGKLARWARDSRLRTMTAIERFILGDWFHWKTQGDHLDRKTVTICAGSTDRCGYVPHVSFDESYQSVGVSYVYLVEAHAYWSVREVVAADAKAAA